jgi:urocanate hydratase
VTDPEISSARQPDQSAVYRRYVQLQSIPAERFPNAFAEGLAGLLLTCVGFGLEGAELALATTISGGTFLGIDPSTEHLKTAVRNGSCDFMVNTLDESLRVLKNELRKKKALSVGLLGEASAILAAMVERGVQPDLVADCGKSSSGSTPSYPAPLMQFIERGAVNVDIHASSVSDLGEFVEVIWTAGNIADLRRMDELALRHLPADDSIRRKWLQQAPGYFHRQRPLQRVLGMHSEEVSILAEALKNAISAGEIQSPATFVRQTEDGPKETIALQ